MDSSNHSVIDPAALLEMAAKVSRTSDTVQALKTIGEYGMSTLSCDGAAVFLYDNNERSVMPLFVLSAPNRTPIVEDKISLRLSRDSGFWRCLQDDAVCTVNVLGRSDARREVIDLSGVTLLALKSMTSDNEPVGVLLFHWDAGKQALTFEENRLISALADQAAAVTARGRLFRELERSEEKYRHLTENARDIIFALDASGRFTFLNSAVQSILGYSPDELVGEYFSEIVTPASWQASQEAFRNARNHSESFGYGWVATSKTGNAVYLDVRASFTRRGGEITGQQGIARDISESRRMRRELRISLKRQSEMKDYLALVTRVQEEERRRISRELHDDTVQALVAIARNLENLEQEVSNSPSAMRRVSDMYSLASSTLENLRRFTRDLRPPMLDDLGLEAALEWLCDSLGERSATPVSFRTNGESRRLSTEIEVSLYRVAQEGVNNALKHAKSKQVSVTLSYGKDTVELSVADDGIGFKPRVRTEQALSGGLGLIGIQERVHLLGGNVRLDSRPGRGTVLSITIPTNGA